MDPNAPEDDNYEFMFSIDAIKRKYMEYLQFTSADFESAGDETEEDKEGDDEKEHDSAPEQEAEDKDEINKDELIDEIKRLDIGNEEETAYVDINYWKTGVECDVDGLLEQLGNRD